MKHENEYEAQIYQHNLTAICLYFTRCLICIHSYVLMRFALAPATFTLCLPQMRSITFIALYYSQE